MLLLYTAHIGDRQLVRTSIQSDRDQFVHPVLQTKLCSMPNQRILEILPSSAQAQAKLSQSSAQALGQLRVFILRYPSSTQPPSLIVKKVYKRPKLKTTLIFCERKTISFFSEMEDGLIFFGKWRSVLIWNTI